MTMEGDPIVRNSTATITADIGPGRQVTSLVLHGVSEMKFDLNYQTLTIYCDEGKPCFDLYTIVSVTYSITSHVVELTVSDV